MTGRGAGFCGGATEDDFVEAAGGLGDGKGFRGGRSRRGGWGFGRNRAGGEYRHAVESRDSSEEAGSLLSRLMDRLEAIEQRIAGLESKD
jgi:hypothetical protein